MSVWRPLQIEHACCPAVMSSNGETSVVLRGVTHGAVDFLIKPVRVEELRNVWQHVVRRRKDKVRPRMKCLLVDREHTSWIAALHLAPRCRSPCRTCRIPIASPYGKSLCRAQELQPSKESDEEGTDDGKQREKKRKEVSIIGRQHGGMNQNMLPYHLPSSHSCCEPVPLCCSGETATRLPQPRSSALFGQWRCTSSLWRLSISLASTVSFIQILIRREHQLRTAC